MNFRKPLSIFLVTLLLGSCAYESPEILDCACNESQSDLDLFPCSCNLFSGSKEPKKAPAPKKQVRVIQQEAYQPEEVIVQRSRRVAPAPIPYCDEEVPAKRYAERTYVADEYQPAVLKRDDLASVKLAFVDFRLEKGGRNYQTKLGDYRFRIFGCRRESKNVFLNQGRAMEKDMRFFDIFFETMNADYPIVVDKSSALYSVSDRIKVPEYLLTAEITDYHMNICDEFDWKNSKKKNARTGSSEITITWRLMDLCKTHVYWKGTTIGYGEINYGENRGETLLIERAYQDALSQVSSASGFENQMAKRVSPEDLMAQQRCWDKFERKADSFQCEFKKEMNYIDGTPEYDSPCIDENSGSSGRGRSDRSEVREDGGSSASGREFEPVKPRENSAFDEDYWVDVPLDGGVSKDVADNRDIVENSLLKDKNSLCIMSQKPYSSLSPETLYRVRASIVAIDNPSGKKGSGLLISDQFILTSADMLNKENNRFDIETINGKTMKASAFRVNPNKNVALLLLDNKTGYKPLPLMIDLPEVNKDVLMTLGMKDLKESEGYLDSNARVTGYRYSPERGAEIIVDTRVQNQTLGGALLDKNANIVGMAHTKKRVENGPDLFIPIETALKALDLSFCDKAFTDAEPWKKKVVTETTTKTKVIPTETANAIDSDTSDKAPVVMKAKERK